MTQGTRPYSEAEFLFLLCAEGVEDASRGNCGGPFRCQWMEAACRGPSKATLGSATVQPPTVQGWTPRASWAAPALDGAWGVPPVPWGTLFLPCSLGKVSPL